MGIFFCALKREAVEWIWRGGEGGRAWRAGGGG